MYWDLLDTYALLATFSNTVSTQQVSNCKSARPSVRPSLRWQLVKMPITLEPHGIF